MSRWWRGEGRASTASHPAPPRVYNPLQVRGRGRGLRDGPSGNALRAQPAVSRNSRERHGPAQGHTTTWDPLGPRWAPFPAPGPADQPQAPQRRVLPHGAAQQILPQGAVFRGQQALLSPGSPGMAPSPCRGGVMGQGLGLRGARAELQPHPASRSSGLDSRTCPACGVLRGDRRPRPTHPGRGRWRRRRPARLSPGPARRAQRAGVRAGSWCGQEAATYRSLSWGSWARTGTCLLSSLRPVPALPVEVRSRTPSGDRTALLQAPLERDWRHLVAALGTTPGEGR